MEMSDDLIESMSLEIDDLIMDFCDKYKLDTFLFTSVMLARLTKIAQEVGYMDEYKDLLERVNEINSETQNGNINTQYH
jgi:hypothetical protein